MNASPVLPVLVRILTSTGYRILGLHQPASARLEELAPLASPDEGTLMARGDIEGGNVSEDSRGLTAQYGNWLESKTALKYVLGNLLAYLLVAIIGYSFVFENWKIHDSVYFAVVVFTTVGYGDLSPSSNVSRAFTMLFALYGIIILGIFLGGIGEFILERHEENMKKRLSNVRGRILQHFEKDDNKLPPVDRSLTKEIMDILLAEAPVILVIVVLGAPIAMLENWDLVEGVYWMVVTATTVGFGDVEPTSTTSRIVCTLWIPLAVAFTGVLLGRIAGAVIERHNDVVEEKFLQRAMTLTDLRTMDTDCDLRVSQDEFLRFMLVALQKVDKVDIDEIMAIFRKLDKGNSGYIEKEDLMVNHNVESRDGETMTGPALKID